MHIDENIIPILALLVGMVIAVTKILTNTISRHRLAVEKIRADAMVRAEEVRSRNELELERLMRQDQGRGNANNTNANSTAANIYSTSNTDNPNNQTDPESNQRSSRERIRD